MEEKVLDLSYRKKVIREIKADENVQRKVDSYKKMSMQNDNFYQYIKESLESKLDQETVQEMTIFADVNLQRRVSKSEATIYQNSPIRTIFSGDSEAPEFFDIYDDMGIDVVMAYANEVYKYQEQALIQCYPEYDKLKARVLLPHHYDAIPYEDDPEKAFCYIISNFDNTDRNKTRREPDRTGFSQGDRYQDGVNQTIGDHDDQALKEERYYWWTKSYNFVTNGKGEILKKGSEDREVEVFDDEGNFANPDEVYSPLFEQQCLPFVDIAKRKDFEYWVNSGNTLFDATITYNTILTNEFQVVEMQGHAQAVYKGKDSRAVENMRIGADKLLFIKRDPENGVDDEFDFVNPNSDLAGIREFRESYLNTFLTSRGLDTTLVSGSPQASTASSGVEKLLQMIDRFEASREDIALFEKAEKQLFYIIKCWLKSYYNFRIEGELVLSEIYQIVIGEDTDFAIEFKKPEMIMSDSEKLDLAQKEIDMGVSSRVHYLMEHKGMDEEQAVKFIADVDRFEQGSLLNGIQRTENQEDGSQSDV